MATSGEASLPPPTPQALQLLMTPTPTDQAGYYQRYVQTWKVLRGPGFPLDEARDLERAAQAFPKDARLQLLYGDILYDNDQKQEARAAWKAARKAQPSNALAARRLARGKP